MRFGEVRALGLPGSCRIGSWFQAVPASKVCVFNPSADLHPLCLKHPPKGVELDDGSMRPSFRSLWTRQKHKICSHRARSKEKMEAVHVSGCGSFLFFKQDRNVGVEACGISLAWWWMRINRQWGWYSQASFLGWRGMNWFLKVLWQRQKSISP